MSTDPAANKLMQGMLPSFNDVFESMNTMKQIKAKKEEDEQTT